VGGLAKKGELAIYLLLLPREEGEERRRRVRVRLLPPLDDVSQISRKERQKGEKGEDQKLFSFSLSCGRNPARSLD
jgi:hypothetical protein